MELLDFVEQYIDDQDSGIKALLAFFLNLVMEYEAEKQAGVDDINDHPIARPTVTERNPGDS